MQQHQIFWKHFWCSWVKKSNEQFLKGKKYFKGITKLIFFQSDSFLLHSLVFFWQIWKFTHWFIYSIQKFEVFDWWLLVCLLFEKLIVSYLSNYFLTHVIAFIDTSLVHWLCKKNNSFLFKQLVFSTYLTS